MTATEAVIVRARHRLRATPATARVMRQEAGLSQQDVADVLSVTRAAVSRWERGSRLPSGPRAVDYIRFLKRACGGTP